MTCPTAVTQTAAVPSRSGAAACLSPLLSPPARPGSTHVPPVTDTVTRAGAALFHSLSLFSPFVTLYASSCILAELHAHATITIDGRRRARRRLDMPQPMGSQLSQRWRLSTNIVAALTQRRARHALSGFLRLTTPRDCFFKVAPRRLARARRNTHATHTHRYNVYLC